MKSFLPIILLGLAVLFWPEPKGSPEPNPEGPIEVRATDSADVTAVKMRAMWRRGTAKAAYAIADGIEEGKFKGNELAEIQEFERTSNDVAKGSVDAGSAWWASAYAEARKLPADQRDKARAAYWRSFGKGVEAQ